MIDKAIDDYIKGLKEEYNTLEKFIPIVVKNVKHITCATHPCQFSHPYANQDKNFRITPIVFFGSYSSDGYVRSGNVKSERSIDMYGSAGYAAIMKFLALTMSNGKSVLDNINEGTPEAIELLALSGDSADKLREQFSVLNQSRNNEAHITSSKIKQVYFPLGENQYHLLSLLTPSPLVYELKNRIATIRNDARNKRELMAKGETTSSFKEIYNLITLKYGGTQPQNISQLNTENGGISKLLYSAPPTLEDHKLRLPRKNFFFECLNFEDFKWEFEGIKKLATISPDSQIPLEKQRKYRDRLFKEIVLTITEKLYAVRENIKEIPNTLTHAQQIWLNKDKTIREEKIDNWESVIIDDMANWIIKNILKHCQLELGDTELTEIKSILKNYEDLWK